MFRILTFLALLACATSCDDAGRNQTHKQSAAIERKVDYSKFAPNNPSGEFFRTGRQPPESKVVIDLRKPEDLAGIPNGVKWFPMGDHEFCAIQGTTDLQLTFPSGQSIREEFAIAYVHKDDEGIFSVKADSIGWLKTNVALQRLDRELKFFAAEGADEPTLIKSSNKTRRWMANLDHRSNMYEGIWYKSDTYSAGFLFSYLWSPEPEIGLRYRYIAELPRGKDRLKANWNSRQTQAEQGGAAQPANTPESKSGDNEKSNPTSETHAK